MNTTINECKQFLSDRSFRLTAERLALKCGVRADLKGSSCLTDAVILYGTEASTAFCEIYRIIGAVRGLKYKSVMREITYAIDQSFSISDNLSAMLGIKINKSDIHSGLVIAYLGKLFKDPDISIY